MTPLLTLEIHERLLTAARNAPASLDCSLDLGRSRSSIEAAEGCWSCAGQRYPYLTRCRDRTIYYWDGAAFEPVSRYRDSLIKLVPTKWGPPTFEIDGIKMLPTAKVSPFDDAARKVELIEPRGKTVLDTCGGLGYFAGHCVGGGALRVLSFEKNPDVIWLRGLNPWSPSAGGALQLTEGDITLHITHFPAQSVDAVMHDPPRFGIAGELYAEAFYRELARVLKPNGRLFHYTGSPNKLSSGRNLGVEVCKRLEACGFAAKISGDGILAVKRGRPS